MQTILARVLLPATALFAAAAQAHDGPHGDLSVFGRVAHVLGAADHLGVIVLVAVAGWSLQQLAQARRLRRAAQPQVQPCRIDE